MLASDRFNDPGSKGHELGITWDICIYTIGTCIPSTVVEKSWHKPYILVSKDPLLTYLFGICAIYFDLKITNS